MKNKNIHTCPHCNRPFSYTEHGKGFTVKDKELMYCPYKDCKKIVGEYSTAGWWTTSMLSI